MNTRPRATWLHQHLTLKPHLHHHHHCSRALPVLTRNFHASRRLHSLTPVQLVQDGFEYIHTFTGLPWGLSIVFSALLLRGIYGIPTYWMLRNQQKMQMAQPLEEAYRNAKNAQAMLLAVRKGEATFPLIKKVSLAGKREEMVLFSTTFRYSRLPSIVPLFYLPFWVHGFNALALISARGGSPQSNDTANTPVPIPSFASEGLLWFPDLTASDPILCAVFTILCVTNYLGGISPGFFLDNKASMNRWGPLYLAPLYNIVGVLGSVAVGIVLMSAKVPAAVTLFCVSSSLCSLIQRKWMKRIIGGKENTISPARPRTVEMRRASSNTDGRARHGKSASVPARFDEFFDNK
jgi:hypothetical protein